MSTDDIIDHVKSLETESKEFKKLLFKLGWHMRGSLSMEEVFQLDEENREIIMSIITENLETTKESGLPYF